MVFNFEKLLGFRWVSMPFEAYAYAVWPLSVVAWLRGSTRRSLDLPPADPIGLFGG